MMAIATAMRHGLAKVLAHKRLVLLLWLVNLALALPAAWLMKDALEGSIGASLVHEKMRHGFDMAWFHEFESNARGLETTFNPSVSGAGPFYGNAEAWLTGRMFGSLPSLVALGVLQAVIWAFLLGGVLEIYGRRPGRTTFFAAAGKYFVRLIKLAIVSGPLYFLVYRLTAWLFQTIHRLGRDVTVERTLLAYALAAAALGALLLVAINMVFDYAKIALVVGEKDGVLAALRDALRFVRKRPLKTFGLYLGLAAIGVALLALYALVGPGGRQSSVAGVAFAFVFSQVFLIVKLGLRLTFYGSQVALYSKDRTP